MPGVKGDHLNALGSTVGARSPQSAARRGETVHQAIKEGDPGCLQRWVIHLSLKPPRADRLDASGLGARRLAVAQVDLMHDVGNGAVVGFVALGMIGSGRVVEAQRSTGLRGGTTLRTGAGRQRRQCRRRRRFKVANGLPPLAQAWSMRRAEASEGR